MSLRALFAFALLPLACGSVLAQADDDAPPPLRGEAGADTDARPDDAGIEATTDAGSDASELFELTFEDGLVNAKNGADEAPGMTLADIPIHGQRSAQTSGAGGTVRKRIPARDGDVFVTFDARLEDGGAGIAELYAGGEALFGVAVGTGDGRIAVYGGSGGATDGGIAQRGSTVRFGVHWIADAGVGPGYRIHLAEDGGFGDPLITGTLGVAARPDGIAVGAIAGDLQVVIDDVRGDTRGP
jgi:hypothetical protein